MSAVLIYTSVGLVLSPKGLSPEFRHEFDSALAEAYCQTLESGIW